MLGRSYFSIFPWFGSVGYLKDLVSYTERKAEISPHDSHLEQEKAAKQTQAFPRLVKYELFRDVVLYKNSHRFCFFCVFVIVNKKSG